MLGRVEAAARGASSGKQAVSETWLTHVHRELAGPAGQAGGASRRRIGEEGVGRLGLAPRACALSPSFRLTPSVTLPALTSIPARLASQRSARSLCRRRRSATALRGPRRVRAKAMASKPATPELQALGRRTYTSPTARPAVERRPPGRHEQIEWLSGPGEGVEPKQRRWALFPGRGPARLPFKPPKVTRRSDLRASTRWELGRHRLSAEVEVEKRALVVQGE